MLIKAFKLMSLIIILYLGISFYPQACLALEKGRGMIKGKIVNKTPGASIKESVDITLYQYLGEKEKGKRSFKLILRENLKSITLPQIRITDTSLLLFIREWSMR